MSEIDVDGAGVGTVCTESVGINEHTFLKDFEIGGRGRPEKRADGAHGADD
jgi:hypothetical protein